MESFLEAAAFNGHVGKVLCLQSTLCMTARTAQSFDCMLSISGEFNISRVPRLIVIRILPCLGYRKVLYESRGFYDFLGEILQTCFFARQVFLCMSTLTPGLCVT
eukprot:scpid68281/ scgid14938/ 